MIYTGLNRTGEIESVKANGGADVAEVYGGISERNPIFYSRKTITGTSPLTFKGLGQPLSDYLISGNTMQDGTPTPDMPVDVVGCGVWDETQQSYKLPVTCGGVTQNIYLSEPIRRYGDRGDSVSANGCNRFVKKMVLDESIYWTRHKGGYFYTHVNGGYTSEHVNPDNMGSCSHFKVSNDVADSASAGRFSFDGLTSSNTTKWNGNICFNGYFNGVFITLEEWKAWLSSELLNGTPVTIYYILETSTTESITLPEITTTVGAQTLSIGTTLQPSAVSITGNIKPTGYGQLLDVNGVDIQDRNGMPIFVH